MTDHEFNEWIRYHGDCVGGFIDWLSKGRDYNEKAAVLRRWHEALADVSFEDAKSASLAIMRGDIDVVAFGSHPKEIRKHAKAARIGRSHKPRRFIDGHPVYDCPICLDEGFVLCYHPVAINEVLKNRDGCRVIRDHESGKPELARVVMPKFATCTYACKCAEGQEKAARGFTVFDERYCIVVMAVGHTEQQTELLVRSEELARKSITKRHNYTPAFARFNEGG